ncbi:DUF3263 domain-containing protein [Microbacterium betulae]|uniref:DUF3263 domain-containing protein n=1 Tax=Microbacterium betulae TaxID=2981139 RepID=A0AA97FII7_9MICO|nr:DUF3263 domain-containing protein [Microbacterium sp. AB]WOF23873.1 DUF3263 domain-containing protein [Microbacterium sp. AB]
MSAAAALSDRESAILAFEATWGGHSGAKEEGIRMQLGLSPARYYQLLGRLIDTEAAIAADPLLVKRLRRIRDERIAERLRVTS